jgi:transmembrane sensor
MSTKDAGKDIREQAARWVERMTESHDSLSPAERGAFGEWIADPLHAQEFYAMHNIVTIMADLPLAERARLSEWAAKYKGEDEQHSRSRRQVFRWVALAASAITVMVIGGFYARSQHMFGGESFATRTGETKIVTFQEGSVAYLNTRTELRWLPGDEDRRVELSEGEVLFDVVHDEARPFSVMLDNSEIRVLGTRFNVYRKPGGDTTVTVLEGTVEVRGLGQPGWVRTLHQDEQIEYRAVGLVSEPHHTEAQKSALWRAHLYQFGDQSIETVVNELTRYTDQRIVIRDPDIAAVHIGGALSTKDIRGSLARLQKYAEEKNMPIEVTESGNTFTLEKRAGDGKRKD